MIKVGVIGCGGMGRDHIRRMSEVITETEVVAVSDVYPEAGQKAAEQYHTKYYAAGEDLIRDSDVEAVVVCTSDATHKQYVLAAIEEEKQVFCEKPLGVTAKECEEIIHVEMTGGRRLVQVGFMRRYDPGYCALKKIIQSGEIGEPLLIHAAHRNLEYVPEHSSDMTICNSGIHEIDICRWLLEEDYLSGQILTVKQNRNTT